MGINWLNTFLVSCSMAIDCMSVGAADAINEPAMKKRKAVLIAFFFGLFQFLMPLIGYLIFYIVIHYGLGEDVTETLDRYIPWIAFALLSFLGIKSIVSWILERRKEKTGEEVEAPVLSIGGIIFQAIATSIDALCIGFVYSPLEYDFGPAILIFGIIGGVTFLLALLALLLGRKIGDKFERWAGLIAGVAFIAIGLKILLEGIF